MFTNVLPPMVDKVYWATRTMSTKSSPLDRIPTSVIKTYIDTFAVLISRLIELLFVEGKFPTLYKHASVTPLLKKPGTDGDIYGKCRPISNLHTISKIAEHVFMSWLIAYVELTQNFSSYQPSQHCCAC